MLRLLLAYAARRYAAPALAAAEALAWHLAGPAWAFTVLALAVGWLATRLPAAMADVTAKAYAVENRVDALVPAVNDAKDAASAAQSSADDAQSTASAAMPKTGGTFTGDVHFYGKVWGEGGWLTCGDYLLVEKSIHVNWNIVTDGDIWATKFHGTNTTGLSTTGDVSADKDIWTDMGDMTGTYVTVPNGNTILHHVNGVKNAHNGLCDDVSYVITRVNALLSALG